MTFVLYKLFSPFNYLRIFHREKIVFDLVLPFLFTIAFLWLNYDVFPYRLSIIGDKGIIDIVNGILQILSGFYIASLAAIATASLPQLNEKMKGIQPIYLKSNKIVTRRVLLTHLFGYLSFTSLLIYFVGAIAKISVKNMQPILDSPGWKLICSFIYIFGVFNLIFVTILGLFFMINDNINRKVD